MLWVQSSSLRIISFKLINMSTYVNEIINHLSFHIIEVSNQLSQNKHTSRWETENFVLIIKCRFPIRFISYLIYKYNNKEDNEQEIVYIRKARFTGFFFTICFKIVISVYQIQKHW